jgi:hypothetical protein
MLFFVNILILFFIILILYQIFLANNMVEGMNNNYKPYDINNPNNALILAQKNAGNIEYIKSRLDSVQGLNTKFKDLSGNVKNLQKQVDDLVSAQKEYAMQMTDNGNPPEITGAVDE